MISKDAIESAYSLFHQKLRVYVFSDSETQKDDIEYAVASFANEMNRELYEMLSEGRAGFLMEHSTFREDLSKSVEMMESLICSD